MTDSGMPHFRTPEDVAPELGMTRTELRRYCRISPDHCTRLSRNRIVMDSENIAAVIAYVKREKQSPVVDEETGEQDHFA